MRGRIIFLIILFSLFILIGFGSNKINVESHGINLQPTKTPLPNNKPANVESVSFDKESALTWCSSPYGRARPGALCSKENARVKVTASARDAENDALIYEYKVSAGRIIGQGSTVFWDLSGVTESGIYTIEVRVDDGCGFCGKSIVKTFKLNDCGACDPPEPPCECPTIDVKSSKTSVKAGDTVTFTAKVSGGTQDDIKYNWTISDGTIVEGQGTSEIKVKTNNDMSGKRLTATVEIGGRCANCERTFSESVQVVKGDNIK